MESNYFLKGLFKKLNTKIIILLLLTVGVACKKENKEPPKPYTPPPTPTEQYWLLGGDWRCIPGGDTMFADLHINYCCSAQNGAKAVYNLISYPIWMYGKVLTVSYYYKSDTIGFSNGLSGANYKEAYFARIK